MSFKKYVKSLLIVSSLILIMSKAGFVANALDLGIDSDIQYNNRKNMNELDITSSFPDDSFRRDIVEMVLENRNDPTTNEIASKDNYKIYKSDLNKIENCLELNLHKNPDVPNPKKIDNLDGIENFKSLEKLDCSSNNLENIDLSENIKLKYIDISGNKILNIDLKNNSLINELNCDANKLTSLDLKNNKNLVSLFFTSNELTEINLSNNKNLESLQFLNNNLKSIDLSHNPKLQSLNCTNNKLESLNLSNNVILKNLSCSGNNLRELNIKGLVNLEYLGCAKNKLQDLNVSTNINLRSLLCGNNSLTKIDISKNKELNSLECSSQYIEKSIIKIGENIVVDIGKENLKLKELYPRNYDTSTGLLTWKNASDFPSNVNYSLQYKYGPVDDTQYMDVNISVDKLVKCRIRYIDYDGSIINEKEILDNSSMNEIQANPQRENYEFSGWRNNKDEKVYTSEQVSRLVFNDSIDFIATYKKESTGSSGSSGGTSSKEDFNTILSKEKITGTDRNDTSVKISQKGWRKADNIVLINDSSISDALSATPLAKSKDAPILLTQNNNLNKLTEKEINRLEVKNVYIVGGLKSVGEKVVSDLKTKGLNVIRISGNDRYETSIKLAKELDKNSKLSKVVVVNGEKGLADAVSMGAISAKEEMPILLTNQNDDMKDIKDLIANKDISKSYVIGGESLFNTKEVSNTLPSVTKIAGSDRTETNSKVINHFYSKEILNDLYVAKNGMNKQDDLVDALSVGVLAGKTESPVVLVGSGLDNSQKELIKNKKFKNITQIGGNGNEKAFEEIEKIVK
ncbi:cell wall-binding repeat-containing protein [Clostridioides sp. ES-S-0006-03]|uniref:cell wall-binding repeat-containing protein n=1 Tax=Clostridioides sp. ES-S-0006-03 TaxID=2770775 RepID=UPI001D0CAC7C|nr:cell wall-binding repeat-containing protein [Clostridioides sp. ES-S-0006-03]